MGKKEFTGETHGEDNPRAFRQLVRSIDDHGPKGGRVIAPIRYLLAFTC